MAGNPLIGALALVAALPAAAAIAPPGVAATLQPSIAEEPVLALTEAGVNVFECRPHPGAPGDYAWDFVAPDATLYDGSRSVARHAAANQFDSLEDRTSVSGFARAAQSAGFDNLPWALYGARSVGDTGLFAGVTSIQRVNTRGGVAPLTGCTAGNAGAEQRVAFSADYYFYRPSGR
jgi:uncharacterized protein DUF3455